MTDGSQSPTGSPSETPDGTDAALDVVEKVEARLSWDGDERGDAVENHEAIANLWNLYLSFLADDPEDRPLLDADDVARMMVLLKVRRGAVADGDIDSDVDIAGYGAIAGAKTKLDRDEDLQEAYEECHTAKSQTPTGSDAESLEEMFEEEMAGGDG